MSNYQPVSQFDGTDINEGPRRSHTPLPNHLPPNYVTPHNTVFTITTTDGRFRSQYYVPDELAGLMSLSELNEFITSLNQIIESTSLGTVPHLIITAIFILAMMLIMGRTPLGYAFVVVFNALLFGVVTSQIAILFFVLCLKNRGKKKCREFIEQRNHQIFLSRGCHWEECVLPNQVFLHLIRHRSQSRPVASYVQAAPATVIPMDIETSVTPYSDKSRY